MIEALFELIFGSVISWILEVIFAVISEYFFESFIQPFRKKKNSNPFFAFIGIIILSSLLSLIFFYYVPERITDYPEFKGLSLVISPFLTGYVLYLIGNWLTKNGKQTSHITTFWGGFVFAFTFSLVRFILIY